MSAFAVLKQIAITASAAVALASEQAALAMGSFIADSMKAVAEAEAKADDDGSDD